jgi:uncharacterized membrane protein SpoIIM required for sporulation
MNVERWLKTRKVAWQRLDDILVLVDRRGLKGLDRQGLQELGRLYRATSADLSRARAMKLGSEVQIYLNNLVVRAHNQVYFNRENRLQDLGGFFLNGFPAMVQQNILYVLLAFLIFIVPAAGCYFEAVKDKNFGLMEVSAGQAIVPDQVWHTLERKKLWTDGGAKESGPMSSLIATNNIKVSAGAFALGFSYGIGTVIVLVFNGMHLGTILGICHDYGMAGKLLTFVAAHGVIELTAIFISGGAGLMIAKSMLLPGQFRRADALALASKPAMQMFCGCVLLLLVAGTIEGFISPRTDINPQIKYAVSASTAILLLLYLFFPRNSSPSRF